ncbi:MAG: SCO family protein [Candidatus Anammoxibacter sp.]
MDGKITVINFIYTSCTSVCQVLTSNFRQLEKSLDTIDVDGKVQLISISIDPDIDTPARLSQYANKQRLDLSRWTLLVSGLNSIEKFSRALGFSNIDKTTHAPGVVIWDDIDKTWQRFVGLTPPHILAKEIAKLPAIKS